MRTRCLVLAAVAACALLSAQSATASVVVSATRVVHDGDARDVGVRMTNKRAGPALVEVWVERADVTAQGQPPAFVPTPSLFRIESGRGQVVRLQRTQAPLPADRESLFWLHVLDVPPNPVGPADGRMKIAVRSRLKLFHRPERLPGSAAKAPDRLRWVLQVTETGTPALRIDNPTPYHVTIASIGEDALEMRGEMVAPFGELVLPLDGNERDGQCECDRAFRRCAGACEGVARRQGLAFRIPQRCGRRGRADGPPGARHAVMPPRCALAVALALVIGSAHAEDLPHATFDASALRRTASGLVDVSRFEQGMPAPVGLHEVELRRNGLALGRQRVRFVAGPTRATSLPCIDAALLLRLDLAPEARATRVPPDACAMIASLVPGASARYDGAELALSFDIPHAALAVRAEDAIDPAQWDAGVSALRVDYSLALGRESRPGETTLRSGLRLALGANLRAWRLRHRTTHAWQTDRAARRDTLGTTLSTDVPPLGAQFQLGDFHTSGMLFDAVGVRGARLESDDRMLPPSLVHYAPVVRGVATTRARVQVRQGGHLLADTFVAPGPFALRDVQPLGYGGALDVRVQESDGTVQVFSVPYAAIPGLLRRGQARFGVVAGRVEVGGAHNDDAHPFMQGTFQRGLRDRLTLQLGAQLAPDYLHVLGGIAMSTVVGAFSLDRTHSRTAQVAGTQHGASLRVAYTGQVPSTNTTIDVAAWRYGNHAFRTVHDALRERDAARVGAPRPDADARERSRIDLALQQRVGRDGNAVFAALTHGVDHAGRTRASAQLAYASRIGPGTVHASLARTLRATQGARDARASLVYTMPLSTAHARHALQAQWRDGGNARTTGIGATGRLFATGATGYALGLSNTQRGDASATTHHASLTHATRAGIFGIGASAGGESQQQSATADGALVLHRHGLTPGPPLGETIALVRARDGRGARIAGNAHIRLDRRGHALLPALAAYRPSQVGVDPANAAPDVHFAWTETRVVPRAGAIIDVVLPTQRARTAWLRPVRDDGTPLPFGTDLTDAAGTSLGAIDRDGAALVRIAADTTAIEARWRDDAPMRCRITLAESTTATTRASTTTAATTEAARDIPCREVAPD
jgi:outer membrane usher protein